jgi:(E)-4-hydroxy-3-methylbut-2-enyl-diphosphate synthase
VETYTLFAARSDYPTHVGSPRPGRASTHDQERRGHRRHPLRGIGDTIRVSLLGDPVPEIAAGFDILRATDRRVTRPEVVACPTCGRLDIDLERIVAEVEAKMST